MRLKSTLLFFCILGLTACDDILEEPDISEENVTVLAPLENAVLTTNTVNFNWEELFDARFYRVQIAEPDFVNTNQIVIDSLFATDSLGFVATQLQQTLLNGNYEWRVKAINAGFETVYTTNSFEVNGDENIDIVPPNTPQLLSPTNNTTQDETTVTFTWSREDVPGTAERDSIYFFSDETLQTEVGRNLAANKSFSAMFSSGNFFWVVQAFDSTGNESAASETFNFTIN